MSILKKLYCLFFGHKTSLFPGISVPIALAWAYPDETKKPELPPPPGPNGIYAVGILQNTVPSIVGPTYNVDLCQRCLALYVSAPPPICKHCNAVEKLHLLGACNKPCGNCGKLLEAHIDLKCPFEASQFKGTRYAHA